MCENVQNKNFKTHVVVKIGLAKKTKTLWNCWHLLNIINTHFPHSHLPSTLNHLWLPEKMHLQKDNNSSAAAKTRGLNHYRAQSRIMLLIWSFWVGQKNRGLQPSIKGNKLVYRSLKQQMQALFSVLRARASTHGDGLLYLLNNNDDEQTHLAND